MFENLDQSKEQNLSGNNPASPKGIPSPIQPARAAAQGGIPPAPVEDMFAGIKDSSAPGLKINGAASASGKNPGEKKKSSGGAWSAILIIVIIIIIIGLGILIAGKFLGVELTNPSSWADKISSLTGSFGKQSAGETVLINKQAGQTPAPSSPAAPANNAETSQPAAPATPSSPAAPAVATGTAPAAAPVPVSTTAPTATSTAEASLTASSTLDSDLDGLTDYDEINVYHTNPYKADTDNDGLTDYQEVKIYHTDPNKADTDGDGYSDGQEVQSGYNPLGPGKIPAAEAIQTFKDVALDFQVSVPASWMFDNSQDDSPTFFSSADCAKKVQNGEGSNVDGSDHDGLPAGCLGFFIQNPDYGQGPDAEFASAKSQGLNPVESTSLISGAVVIREDASGLTGGYYPYETSIYFPAEKKLFYFSASDQSLEYSILPTLKLLK
jgi:Bacterial TSP3 repeat